MSNKTNADAESVNEWMESAADEAARPLHLPDNLETVAEWADAPGLGVIAWEAENSSAQPTATWKTFWPSWMAFGGGDA